MASSEERPGSGRPASELAAVIPAYERAGTVGRAIESVLAQTVPPAELIVVDDGSSDATVAVAEGYGPDVTVLRQANAGASAARNRGVEHASSRWIAFLDSDDTWDPGHLERIAAAIERTDGRAGLYFSDTELASGSLQGSLWQRAGFAPGSEPRLVDDATAWAMLPLQPMMLQSSAIARASYRALGGLHPALRTREDTHLFLLLGIGQAACAVPGIGARMGDDAAGERLSSALGPDGDEYWRATSLLYADALARRPAPPAVRRELSRRAATGDWRLARIALRERSTRAAVSRVAAALRRRPLLPADLVRERLAR